MKIYKVDTKETVWHRDEYEVEDDVTPEQLYKMIKQGEIVSSYCEGYLYDTAEQMLTRDNDGQSTVEVMELSNEMGWTAIWGNGKQEYGQSYEKQKEG
jgi:cobyrinic acid a,c-diamide synthase